jgi:hypothetical protein
MPKLKATPLAQNPKAQKPRAKKPRKRALRRNPAFGKRKASHQAFKRKRPKERVRFGKRKEPLYAIVGRAAKSLYYFTGSRFDTNRSHAAFYRDHKTAVQTLRSLRGRAPDAIKSVSVQPV